MWFGETPILWYQNVQAGHAMLIAFQYRRLKRILPTNKFLAKIGIKQDPSALSTASLRKI